MALAVKNNLDGVKRNRILTFDLLRGFFLIVILIDHIELYPSLFDLLTGRGRLYASAAEGFFALSGLLVGMVYRRRLARGIKYIFGRMWLRALELYIASIVLTLGYVFWAITSNHPAIKYGLPDPINWWHIINQTLLVRFGFGWSDFLPRFVILMLMAPSAFYLIAKGFWRIMVSLSVGLWVARNQNFTLAWQLLFNLGMLAGFYWDEITAWFKKMSNRQKKYLSIGVYGLSAATLAISYASVFLLSYADEHFSPMPPWLQNTTIHFNNLNDQIWVHSQKWTLGPLRIVLFFLWFSALYLLVHRREIKINQRTKGVLELLGRNSLYVYVLHSFIVFAFKFYIPVHTNIYQNFGITLLALLALVYGTQAYQKLRSDYPKITLQKFYMYLAGLRRSVVSSLDRT